MPRMQAQSEELVWTQLVTRIPISLHRRVRLHCVRTDASVMGFVTQALGEKLGASSGSRWATNAKTKPYGRKRGGDSSDAGRRLHGTVDALGVAAPR
jgi:hypothetical protein